MTREEQIEKIAYKQKELVNIDTESFIKGAKWADNHPKSPWISVNEKLPLIEKYDISIMVLAVNTEEKINFSKYDYDAEEWITPESDIFTHWMPIPKLPKE